MANATASNPPRRDPSTIELSATDVPANITSTITAPISHGRAAGPRSAVSPFAGPCSVTCSVDDRTYDSAAAPSGTSATIPVTSTSAAHQPGTSDQKFTA